jgi:AraC-like DNA-binding protein
MTARVQRLSSAGVYLVGRRPPSVGEKIQLSGDSEDFVGTVERVERWSEGEWGFMVGFSRSPDKAVESREKIPTNSQFVREPDGIRNRAFDYYERLSRLKEFVSEHFSEDLPLERAARVAALEKTYFSAFFHSKVGITYREWIQNLRVRKAITLMKRSNHSITEVAHAVGFGDLRTFQRAFRKWTDMAPREFKKIVRQ